MRVIASSNQSLNRTCLRQAGYLQRYLVAIPNAQHSSTRGFGGARLETLRAGWRVFQGWWWAHWLAAS